MLILIIDPINNFFKSIQSKKLILVDVININSKYSVTYISFYCLKIQLLKLIEVIEFTPWVYIEHQINQTIINKSISYSYEVVNNELSTLLVYFVHEFVRI